MRIFLRISFLIALFLLFIPRVLFSADNVDIAILLKGLSNPYWQALEEGLKEKSKELNLNTYIQGVLSDSDAEGQLNVCNTMLLRKPKALIFASVNNVNLAPCLKKASDFGVLLIDVDGGMDQVLAKKIGIDLKFSVASDNYALGKQAAEYLAQDKGKVLLIEGFAGSIPAVLRAQGFKENINKDLMIIASLPGDWDRLKAANIASDIFTKHPDLTAVFAANDVMALGAAEALITRGGENVKIIGVDGNLDAVKAIKSGRLTASIAQLPYLMGGQALEKTNKLLFKQEEFEFDQKVPILTLDRVVLSNTDEPLLQYLR
ncbi:MAG: substrate-binding domain-containing protein [Bdellovibrionota bacterium]